MPHRTITGDPARQLLQLLDAQRALADDPPMALRSPEPASQAQVVAEHPLGKHLQAMAGTALEASVDHFRSALWFISAGLTPVFAQLTLFRSAHEAAIRAEWLLDGAAAVETKIARGCGLYVADLRERAKFDRQGFFAYGPHAKPAEERIKALRTTGTELGLTGPSGYFPGESVATFDLFKALEPPIPTADRKSVVCGSGWWRLLSGLAHGMAWPNGILDRTVVSAPTEMGVGVQAAESSDVVHAEVATRAGAALRRAYEAHYAFRGIEPTAGVRMLPSIEPAKSADD